MYYRLEIREEAERDMAEARDLYNARRDGLGGEFIGELRRLIGIIHEYPKQFGIEYRNFRATLPRRFPYVVYFKLKRTVIEVLAVLHWRRNRTKLLRRR